MDADTSLTISAWADNISLALVGINLLVGGLNPKRPVWGYSRSQRFFLILLLFTSLVWSLFRLIHEGLHREAGPREFLTANIIYIARWLYLWIRMNWRNSKAWKVYRVATALRDVHMVRFGKCSEEVESDPHRRKGVPEVVIRRGVKSIPQSLTLKKPKKYWRGHKTFEYFHEDVGIYEVSLIQKELHQDKLDRFGTIEFMSTDDAAMEDAYKNFYTVVMRAVGGRAPTDLEVINAERWDPHVGSKSLRMQRGYPPPEPANGEVPRVEVDFSRFTDMWSGLPVEGMAISVDAKDPRMIGRVARRIAADAVGYINDEDNEYELRTVEQVRVLNQCLREAAGSVFISGLADEKLRGDNLV